MYWQYPGLPVPTFELRVIFYITASNVIHFCDRMWSFQVKWWRICAGFFYRLNISVSALEIQIIKRGNESWDPNN